ncbi:MAG: hypothetical protein ACE37F_19115 [Nannocystaceae bacterium]|nr:hypothetical protein [bacterium]
MQSLSQRVGRVNLKPKLACMRGDVLISACGSPGSLYPSCDKDFQDACKVSGGSTNSCGPACQATVNCLDDSDLYHACDEKFIVACGRDMEGTFEFTSECDDGTCCAGNCSRPD